MNHHPPPRTPKSMLNFQDFARPARASKKPKDAPKKLFRTSALSSDGLHPNFIWLAIKTGLQIVDQISLARDFICIEKCTFYCDSVSFQLKETTPLAKIRRKPHHFDRFPVLLPPSPRNQCWDVVPGPWQHRGGHAMMQSNIDFGGEGAASRYCNLSVLRCDGRF